ncbi:MAG: N-6 DNA methylase [Bacteroidales bacterium]|nr:N-6 DNA methylase [Bacteroidales bacterium]
MLDTTTKKRIDDCRDILVGKLPDPKAQIEQITIGLIYKFMDDMDKEAVELGGTPKFFSNYTIPDPKNSEQEIMVEFEKYSWDRLFDSKVTAAEMLKLYSEAIEGMEKNPNIPQLFRDIFNNAYLPYRDPETLKLFLKTIGEFEYTHSEKLGDAFEYLLSVMGSQGDAGQFRTPRHIIDFLVAAVDPDKTDTLLDPACGTSGFLISAYKHILLKDTRTNKENLNIFQYNNNYKSKPFNNLGDGLTPDERKKLINNISGYDISPDMVRLSLVNLYLHGFSNPHINEYDTLSSEDRWNESYDVILANPPFMSPKGGIRPHKRFTIQSKRSEVLFVDYIAEHLNPRGRAGIIVPEGVIFQSGTAYKDLRKMLVENYLYAVVSLPAGVFNPYSGVKTSILLMDKEIAKTSDEILFVKIDNDGYNLGAQRTAVKGGQLEEAIELLKQFKAAKSHTEHHGGHPDRHTELVSGSGSGSDDEMLKQVQHDYGSMAHAVLKSEIGKNGEYNLSGERYKVNENLKNAIFEFVEIGKIVNEIKSGFACGREGQADFGVPHIRPMNITEKGTFDWTNTKYITEDYFSKYKEYTLMQNDVLFNNTNSKELIGKTCIIEENLHCGFSNHMTRIRVNREKVIPKYLSSILHYMWYMGVFLDKCNKWVGQAGINNKMLSQIQIPLPHVSVQSAIVSEIESYQKIIDGAKQVVENYKPNIDIDPDWEMVELGEVCEINPKKSELQPYPDNLEVSFVPMANLNENQIDFVPKQIKLLREVVKGYTYFREDDVLLAKVTPCFENGKAGIAKGLKNGIGFGSSEYYVFRPNDKILSTWIYLNIITNGFKEKGKLNMTGTGGLQRVPKDFVISTLIPLPPVKIQQQIISQIEKEQELVNANKQLIEIFEQKIKDRIAKVWGEEQHPVQGQELNLAAEQEGYYGTKK